MKTDNNNNMKNDVRLVIAGVLVGVGLLAAYSNPKEIRDPKEEEMLQDP